MAACDDCDDTDPSITATSTYYLDGDGDGYGTPTETEDACDAPLGYVDNSDDCNDDNAGIYPGASESCNSLDDDCDGETDEEALDATDYYVDSDGDGYGDGAGEPEASCFPVAGLVDNGDDCNDEDADVSPGATEICDGVDNDCNDEVDDDAEGMGTYYLDEDGDGFGVTESSITSCTLPEGYVVDDGDCNDDISAINPDAEEPCDEVDNDCDGEIDEEGLSTWYEDADGDGYGTDTSTIEACAAIVEGYAAYEGDCDDTNGDVNPDADEVCDEIDNDCDGDVDSGASDASTFYADTDADGFGDVQHNDKLLCQRATSTTPRTVTTATSQSIPTPQRPVMRQTTTATAR